MSDIKLLRLVTGEEILGELVVADTEKYQIKNPVMLVVTVPNTVDQNGERTPAIGFLPWMIVKYTNLTKENPNGIVVKNAHVMFVTGVPTQIEDEYKKLFSPVVVPKSSLIIPG